MVDKANQELFAKYGVFSPAEMNSRYEIERETYTSRVHIEGQVALAIARSMIRPVVADEFSKLATALSVARKDGLKVGTRGLKALALKLGAGLDDLHVKCEKLDKALSGLLEGEIPECMIDNEVEAMVRDTESRISMNGIDFKTYLSYFGMTLDQYKQNSRPAASDRVRSRLALEKIAELESVEITDEQIEDEYKAVAERYNVELDYAKENLPKEEIVETLKLRAAMDIVKAAADVTYLDKAPEPEEKPEDKE